MFILYSETNKYYQNGQINLYQLIKVFCSLLLELVSICNVGIKGEGR